MPKKIAINGFGRIGLAFFKQALAVPELEIVAINDLREPETLAGLLREDPIYGTFDREFKLETNKFVFGEKEIELLKEKDPAELPWKNLDIDIVIESTGAFESSEKAKAHLDAGAKRVVITTVPHDNETPVATPNINTESLETSLITSPGSCTTNAVMPLLAVIDKNIGIEKTIIDAVHSYTASQTEESRGSQSIIPYKTGAASAVSKIVPGIECLFDGFELRVPAQIGSVVDMTFISRRHTSANEINEILGHAAQENEWDGILTTREKVLSSKEIIKDPHGSIVDLALTRVIDGNLVKVMAWYDNEWGYASMLLKHVLKVSELI
jgi:glyceraldehyde 3-phosphate dehydrogenase